MPNEIFYLHRCECFNLNNNKIKAIPDNIPFKLKKLQWLDLNDNEIEYIPESIKNINPMSLNLDNNKIKNIPDYLFEIKNLQRLLLLNNEIKSVPKSILNAKRLHTLRVNKEVILPEKIKEHLRKLTIENDDKNKGGSITIYRD